MELGIVGLGKIGGNLALQGASKGMRIVGTARPPLRPDLAPAGIEVVPDLPALVGSLTPPRRIYLSVPAGPAVDAVLDQLVPLLAENDVVMDGGNSHFRDSVGRHRRLAEKGIHFVDIGTSGGPNGARHGACFMVGGDAEAVASVKPILEQLALPEAFLHAGPPGAGHYVKLVHNAIEFGMLEAIGEGVALLEKADYDLDLPAVFHNWAHGSVIRGWLIELMEKGLREGPALDEVSPYVEDTGEVNWIIEEATCREVPIPVIAQSVWALMQSRDPERYASKSVALMRNQFGGHPFGPAPSIAQGRRISKVTWAPCREETKTD